MKLRAPLFLAVTLVAGCGPKKVDKAPAFDADANSGPDGKRSGAVAIEVNKISAPDEVNYDKQDQTDWKSLELKGKPALLEVELHWDNANSDMSCDVFDGFGTQIATGPGLQPGAQVKKVTVQIDNMGTYFIRVQAPKKGDGSVYTLEAKWSGAVEEAPTPPPVVEKDPPKEPVKKPPKEHHEHASKKFDPENGVQGRIVSSYREGGSMVLHIDKGSAAGVKVGSFGTILDGPTGANALEGGSFSVTQVIDDSKCIAKTGLHSIGHNNRVSINAR